MKKVFARLNARACCHATENLARVRVAMVNLLGDVETKVSRAEGAHGNPITILESTINDSETILGILAKLSKKDLEELLRTLDSRIDDDCNLFLRIDKQAAYQGSIKLGRGDDVISVRIRIISHPAKPSVASDIVRDILSERVARMGDV